MPPNISFIVAVRDEPQYLLEATIDGLLRTSTAYRREIVVVDDGSLVPVILERPEIIVLRNSVPIGSSRSRHAGASLARGDVLAFLDPHMNFAPDWLDKMLAHVDTGALLCSAWWDYDLTRPLCWGADFKWCGVRDYAAGQCPGLGFEHRTAFPGPGAAEVPMLIGASYMMLCSSYDKVGGFSPFFRIWGRLEQDISTRAWLVGLGVKCVADAHVGHFSRTKFPYPVAWEDIEFNQIATVRTNFEQPTIQTLEQFFEPLPAQVQTWLGQVSFEQWRGSIQRHRQISDGEFFKRFVAEAPRSLLTA
jgi:glycosyltransferase involved in cell wall biosynthesis